MRTGDSLLGKGVGRLDKSLLFRDLWRFENSPPATEVWFRCAPPHVASLINSVQDRRDMRLMSGGDRGPAWHWSGDSLLDEDFYFLKHLLLYVGSSFLRSHPRRQRCGSAALHHTSLRSLTAKASMIGSCCC